jgi:hypothetical protein
MVPEGSSPCSQEPATCPYPEPNESNPHPLFSGVKSVAINVASIQLKRTEKSVKFGKLIFKGMLVL